LEYGDHTEIRHPSLCPELRLRLLDRHSPLGRAIKRHGLYAVHEVFPGLCFPPHWAYAFAGGQALGRFVLDHPKWVGRKVLDVGTGSGLVAIAAAKAGASRVLALDRDPLALAAASNNASLNGVSIETRLAEIPGFDLEGFDVILASEVFYDDDRVLRYLTERAADGRTVLVADPGRGIFSPTGADELARYACRTEPDLEWVEQAGVYQLRPRAGSRPSV
jgi:predicted nicotinamide N-methyase